MKAVYEGLQVPIDAALRIESRYFAKTADDAAGKARHDPHLVPVDGAVGQRRDAARPKIVTGSFRLQSAWPCSAPA